MAQSDGTTVVVSGRIVWTSGELFKGKLKVDDNGRPVMNERNGEQVVEYGFGLAIPKQHAGSSADEISNITNFWNALQGQIKQMFPQGAPANFATKMKDGDTDIDPKGVPYSEREGYKGCMVFAMTTQIPINFFVWQNNTNVQVSEGIKSGDYVQVAVGIKVNVPQQASRKPSVFLNPNMVRLIGYGKEIKAMANGNDAFGFAAPPKMAGASETPVGESAPMPGVVAAPVAAPVAPTPAAVAPEYGVIPQHLQPQAAAPTMPAFPPIPGSK